jgi:hypothetical protein
MTAFETNDRNMGKIGKSALTLYFKSALSSFAAAIKLLCEINRKPVGGIKKMPGNKK